MLSFNCRALLFLQVHYILQEVVMGGMVLETNMNEIVAQVEVQNRMEKSEVRPFLLKERTWGLLHVLACKLKLLWTPKSNPS